MTILLGIIFAAVCGYAAGVLTGNKLRAVEKAVHLKFEAELKAEIERLRAQAASLVGKL